ncbi:MAG: RNA polymerase-binding protein DksA [Gammaproteobacteria bacterium]|nr:RNA polymerase-binding protein DksA [Gammaproteobacteria bacterium]
MPPKPMAKKPVKSPTKPAAAKPSAAPVKPQAKAAPAAKPQVQRVKSTDSSQFSAFTPYKEKSGEEYMNPAQVEHFREILESWKQELMEKVDETVHHMQDEASNFPDPNDRASQESDFTMELRARDRERKLIKKIEEGMQRLDDGDFGFCESCGVEIGVRRLEARPTATLCIDCKELDEIRERQSKG